MPTGKLNAKQARFVREYLKDSNGTQAAIRAGYSPKTAGSQGHDLLKKPEVKAAIDANIGAQGITAEKILKEIASLAFMQADEVPMLVSGEGVQPWVKCSDKTKALELLGKNRKLWTDKLELSGRLTLEQLLAEGEAGG